MAGTKDADMKEVTKAKVEPKDRTSLVLRDPSAVKFWKKKFGAEKDIISNEVFGNKVLTHIKNNRITIFGKVGQEDERKAFVESCCKTFFVVPHPEKYPEQKADIQNFVDKEAIQYLINAFGPWIHLFKFLYNNFYDVKKDGMLPLEIFHGIISDDETKELLNKGNASKSSKKMRYLLRMRTDPETKNVDLVLSTIRRGKKKAVHYSNNTILRKKFKPNKGKKSSESQEAGKSQIKVQFSERVASVGKFEVQVVNFTKLEYLLDYVAGNPCDEQKNGYRGNLKIKTRVYTADAAKEKKLDLKGESSDPPTPEERAPMKVMAMDEDETDEETLEKLRREEEELNKKLEAGTAN